jgi:hypothetical protein
VGGDLRRDGNPRLIAKTGIAGAGSSDLLNWYIPIGLVILGFQFNKWYPSHLQQSGP